MASVIETEQDIAREFEDTNPVSQIQLRSSVLYAEKLERYEYHVTRTETSSSFNSPLYVNLFTTGRNHNWESICLTRKTDRNLQMNHRIGLVDENKPGR